MYVHMYVCFNFVFDDVRRHSAITFLIVLCTFVFVVSDVQGKCYQEAETVSAQVSLSVVLHVRTCTVV